MQLTIKRINELAKIAKERELSPEEFVERERLRKTYLSYIRGATEDMLLHSKVKDREGNDVTPQKLKEAQHKRKLRIDEN